MVRALAQSLRTLVTRGRLEQDLDDELKFHLEMERNANISRGMSEDAAHAAALRSFGGVARTKDDVRDSWGTRVIDNLWQDVRFGLRNLLRNPGFSAVAILTLALGIGANTAIFSVVHGVLLNPLPYQNGDRLVHLLQPTAHDGTPDVNFSPPEISDYQTQNQTLEAIAEYHSMPFNLLGRGEPRRVQTGVVSAAFFDVLGVTPIAGRTFRTGEDRLGADPVLVLSYEFWQRAFGGDPGIVGQTFQMNDRVHTVVGVLPPVPQYPNENDVYMPISACPFRSSPRWSESRVARGSSVFARLKPWATIQQAIADLDTIARRLHATYPQDYPAAQGFGVSAVSLRDELTRDARPTFLVLLGTAGFVLLIACANVANLTLARLVRREREIALRSALGAGRSRLLRQMVTESTLLAIAGGGLGLLMAFGGLDVLTAFAARFTPRAREITIDGTVLAFTLAVSLLTGLVFGLLPAFSGTNLVGALKDGSDRSSPGGLRIRGALIVSQLAISFVLLTGAGLMIRSFIKLQGVDIGFKPQNVLTVRMDLSWSKYQTSQQILNFSQPLIDRVSTLPGVVSAAVANTFPLNGGSPLNRGFQIEGRPIPEGYPEPQADLRTGSADYFKVLGVPLMRGRMFEATDRTEASTTALINQSLAARFWKDSDPIGRRITLDHGEHWLAIVGVVGDVKQYGLDKTAVDELYIPWERGTSRDVRLLALATGDPTGLAPQIRQAVDALDPAQPVTDVETLDMVRSEWLASPRLTMTLLGLFAGLALAITATGLLGLVAFSVSQRTHEIGIRMALGAERGSVLLMVLRQGMTMVAIGLAMGLGGALLLARLMSGLLFDVEPNDPVTFLLVAAVLSAVAAIACLVPARRATAISPLMALRSV